MFSIEENRLTAYHGSSLEELSLPQDVESVSSRVFLNHSELTRVVLNDSVKTVGEAAFSGCTGLEEICFGSAVKRLNEDCFSGCTALRSVDLPDHVASIRSGAFRGCTALEQLHLPSGLRRCIESDTFADCRSLTQVVIPAQVGLIEYNAFGDCSALRTVVFENPQISIERGAFVGCTSLHEETARFVQEHSFSRVIPDIRSAAPGPVGRLSNFTARQFVFDGVPCGSLEGVLQSFKFDDPDVQRSICALAGSEARTAGLDRDWRTKQELYWLGTVYPRTSEAYQQLLDRLYEAVFEQDASFRSDLYHVRGRELSHRLGRRDTAQTILTRQELTSRLERLSLRAEKPE